ncbi:hypothetical protein [Oligoflexus tunisiensis]|uniref:RIFT barrel domain-containing protein n=1 Tax=Oligoflexus tunisiensis TaxID=708132 RepID=UPI00114D32F7|nr:hypothetical protein [Oligoflexus tunisiensis]
MRLTLFSFLFIIISCGSKPDATPASESQHSVRSETDGITLYAESLGQKTGRVLVSNGVPFAPGRVTSVSTLALFQGNEEIPVFIKPLAQWPDGSVRSVLLQFEHSADQLPVELTLRLKTSPSTPARAAAPIPREPAAVAFPDAAYLTETTAFGPLLPAGSASVFPDAHHRELVENYDKRQQEGFDRLKGSEDWGKDARLDGYYSTSLNWYLHFVRTGNLEVFSWARRELLHYREDQIIQSGPNAGKMNGRRETRYLYLRALEADYLLTGDPENLRVGKLMADYLLKATAVDFFYFPKNGRKFWTEREVAFPILGLITYGRMSGETQYLEAVKPRIENLLKTQDQYPDGGWIHNLYNHDTEECPDENAYGGSPFMTGLLFEALIAYHEWFADPRIVASVKKAADWLYRTAWLDRGFAYMTACGYQNGGGYLEDLRGPQPDLNLLIVQGYGFAYWAGGKDKRYLEMGWEILDKGVNFGHIGNRKQFNQAYRSSGPFLWYAKH